MRPADYVQAPYGIDACSVCGRRLYVVDPTDEAQVRKVAAAIADNNGNDWESEARAALRAITEEKP